MFFITTLKFKNEEVIRSRTVGYFINEQDAIIRLENNVFDLYECGYYDYAIIENIPEGIYQYDDNPKWFKWDETKQGFYSCEVPKGFENAFGLSIG